MQASLLNKKARVIIHLALGIRLAVGQRTLNPYGQVRILDPQPIKFHVHALYQICCSAIYIVAKLNSNVVWVEGCLD
jgi:hypothetical protein